METLLDDNNLIEGIRKCIINAKSLIDDALLLKEHGRFARAYTLFQLSIEELGKSSILYFFATLQDVDKETNLKKFRKEFLNHKVKTERAINFDAIILSSIKEKTDRHKFLYSILMEHQNIEIFNDLKNYSLYTSLIEDKFLLPCETISEELLSEIEARATVRFDLIKPTIEFLLKGFDEVKQANLKINDDQIKEWADEFIFDFLNGKA
jgi:AbiV family abortive infection protein